MRYEVVVSRVAKHPDGRTASIYGSYPGEGFEIKEVGFTIKDNERGTVGMCRKPFETKGDADDFCDRLNNKE